MHAHLHMCSHVQKQGKQWWEVSGLEAFAGQTAGGTGSCALCTDGMALSDCIGFGMAALLGSGTGIVSVL